MDLNSIATQGDVSYRCVILAVCLLLFEQVDHALVVGKPPLLLVRAQLLGEHLQILAHALRGQFNRQCKRVIIQCTCESSQFTQEWQTWRFPSNYGRKRSCSPWLRPAGRSLLWPTGSPPFLFGVWAPAKPIKTRSHCKTDWLCLCHPWVVCMIESFSIQVRTYLSLGLLSLECCFEFLLQFGCRRFQFLCASDGTACVLFGDSKEKTGYPLKLNLQHSGVILEFLLQILDCCIEFGSGHEAAHVQNSKSGAEVLIQTAPTKFTDKTTVETIFWRFTIQ